MVLWSYKKNLEDIKKHIIFRTCCVYFVSLLGWWFR